MKIKVGNYDVLYSGTVIGLENEPIDFHISPEDKFILRMVFITKEGAAESSIFAEKFGENGVQINFYNVVNPLGQGNSMPISLGKIRGRSALFSYRIYPLDKAGKHVHYTLLLESEVNNV